MNESNLDDYRKMVISEVFERIRMFENLHAQAAIFFGTASFTILAAAISVQRATMIFVAASILLFFIGVDQPIVRHVDKYKTRGREVWQQANSSGTNSTDADLLFKSTPDQGWLHAGLFTIWAPVGFAALEILLGIVAKMNGWQW